MLIVPTTIKAARIFVAHHHRHHAPDRGGLFACAVEHGGEVVGVAVVGRPKARALQDGRTAEVTRLCVSPKLIAGQDAASKDWTRLMTSPLLRSRAES